MFKVNDVYSIWELEVSCGYGLGLVLINSIIVSKVR